MSAGTGASPAPRWSEDDPDTLRLADAIEAEAWEDQVAACPPALRDELGLRAERVGGALALALRKLPIGQFNRAIGLGVERPADEDDVDALCRWFEAAGVPGAWLHMYGPEISRPAALQGWLAARGFAPAPRPAWVKVMHAGDPPTIRSALVVREVEPDRAGELGAAIVSGFGMPPFIAPWLAAYVGRPHWRCYGAFERAEDGSDRIVGGGMLYVRGDRAWLGVGAVLPSHRRRGAQGALMSRRIADARAAGATAIATETGAPTGQEENPSLANMYRCGFVRVGLRQNVVRVAPPRA